MELMAVLLFRVPHMRWLYHNWGCVCCCVCRTMTLAALSRRARQAGILCILDTHESCWLAMLLPAAAVL